MYVCVWRIVYVVHCTYILPRILYLVQFTYDVRRTLYVHFTMCRCNLHIMNVVHFTYIVWHTSMWTYECLRIIVYVYECIYVCTYVCVYVCMCIYMRTTTIDVYCTTYSERRTLYILRRTYVRTLYVYLCGHMYMCVRMYVMYVCVGICVYIVNICIYACVCIYVQMYVCIYVRCTMYVYLCGHVYMFVSVWTYVYVCVVCTC